MMPIKIICFRYCERETLPTARVADACRRVPGYGYYFIEGFLNPDRMVVVEVNDETERFAIIKSTLDNRVSSHICDTALDPGVSSNAFRLR